MVVVDIGCIGFVDCYEMPKLGVFLILGGNIFK